MSTQVERFAAELLEARAIVTASLRRGLRLDQIWHAMEYIWDCEWMLITAQLDGLGKDE